MNARFQCATVPAQIKSEATNLEILAYILEDMAGAARNPFRVIVELAPERQVKQKKPWGRRSHGDSHHFSLRALFAAFTTVYFLLRSPVLGALDTVLGLAAALISFMLATRIDRTASLLIGLRVAWLLLASYVSVWIALNTVDPFFAR